MIDSAGFPYALILGIIRHMATAFGATRLFGRDAEGRIVIKPPGVILIDEVEAHLHPSWQRLFGEWLRTRFPHVQFFLTTHSPIIVQAADPGGVFILPLPGELARGRTVRRLSPHEQERVTLGRAEKVLLGEAEWSGVRGGAIPVVSRLALRQRCAGRIAERSG